MGAPQYIMVFLLAVGLYSSIINHGQPRPPMNANTMFLSVMINLFLLYWGGFFNG